MSQRVGKEVIRERGGGPEEDVIRSCAAKPRSDLRIRSHQYEEMLEHRAEHDEPPGKSKLG